MSLPETSKALQANLAETAVTEVIIPPEFILLCDLVADYRGIHDAIHGLLYEISHPYRNWNQLLPKLRAFALKNNQIYARSSEGPKVFTLFTELFLKALDEAGRNSQLRALAMESLLAYVERLLAVLAEAELCLYQDELDNFMTRLGTLPEEQVMLMVQGHHPMKKMAQRLLAQRQEGADFDLAATVALLRHVLTLNYRYWLSEDDPLPWFEQECGAMCADWQAGERFGAISHARLNTHLARLAELAADGEPATLEAMLDLPSHMDIVRLYREIPERLAATQEAGGEEDRYAENRKLIFLFRIMKTTGLYLIHEETLREINRNLVSLIREQPYEEIESFLLTTMRLLQENVQRYPHTALQCIQILGSEAFARGSSLLAETFLWETVRFGFQYANVVGVDDEWQPITNPSHLTNIRAWLNLIMQEPKWCATLFSALIININLSGTCVKDTDLFQRDITKLLNHAVGPVYNLVKQFTKLMPVFFNDIGAEGKLRDVSTEIDEIHKRKDRLIHFLRKQSHVESSNLIVDFIQAIISFWAGLDKEVLVDYLPAEVLEEVQVDGPFVEHQHQLIGRILAQEWVADEAGLLAVEPQRLDEYLANQEDIPAHERLRFRLLVEMYRLLDQKYNLGVQEIRHQLEEAVSSSFPELQPLLEDLVLCDTFQCLGSLLTHLEKLKEIILSDEVFTAREDIFYKRHIAVDIPSVYGRYREKKFDALSLTFRLENLANIYLERLPEQVQTTFVTRATFMRVVNCLRFYLRALKIDGIISRKLETYVSLLSNSLALKRFSYTQYLDIFRGLSEGVKDVIYAYYTNIHQNNLSIIIPQMGRANLLAKYRNLWRDSGSDEEMTTNIHQISEAFMRDLIAGTFGLQHLDNFIATIYHTLERQREILDEQQLDLLLTYNTDKIIHQLGSKTATGSNLVLLGNKGYNLTLMAGDGLPVPPGFVITTEVFRCWPVIKGFNRAREDFMDRIRESLSSLEKQTGRTYGDIDRPLLVSVRSGASISMPGMMATIHNVGLNEEICLEFVRRTGKEYLAWDNFRRFLQSWAMACGVEREVFQTLMNEAKKRHGISKKAQFSAVQMRELALAYQKKTRSLGIGIPNDPWLQLTGAIEMVLTSWDTAKTQEYRKLMGVSDAWGTAVIVQAMVYGNRSRKAGSGVLFTAHPYRRVRRVALWGDYSQGDQGEDIVSGLVSTYPVSIEQAEIDGRPAAESLERVAPAVYERLLEIARQLVYEKGWNPQEIEFTFEGPAAEDLFVLQTRDMITIKKREQFSVFVDGPEFDAATLGKGIGVSGSAMCGRAVFSDENIDQLREREPKTPLILIRQDTVPEDIREISRADGLLTARGGQTSHASVITLRLEKTCVVGCQNLRVFEWKERCEIGEHVIRFGDWIAIDGRKGLLVKGKHPVKEEVHILPM
ncbi:MAG: PEP/pyruvate-binding domain-containing protein [Thermodesulfobacteriota bacterium]